MEAKTPRQWYMQWGFVFAGQWCVEKRMIRVIMIDTCTINMGILWLIQLTKCH